MTWLVESLSSSLGKKLLVGLTGLGLSLFLIVHLAGNLLLFAGKTPFDSYAEKLSGSPFIVPAEIGLAFTFLLHIALALTVTVQNWRARPSRYGLKRWEGGKSVGSATMWITGPLILVFLIVHLLNFRLSHQHGSSMYDLVVAQFRSLPYAVGYAVAMCTAALHLSHGFQSAFRTLGLVHPKYSPAVTALGWVLAGAVAVGFSSAVIWIHFFVGPQA